MDNTGDPLARVTLLDEEARRLGGFLAGVMYKPITALMLGIILLIGAFAVRIGLASAAGTFLLGMLINSYDVEERLHRTPSLPVLLNMTPSWSR